MIYCRQKKTHFNGDYMLLNVAPVLLNCHLLGKTTTKKTNVIFILYLLATVRVQLCCQLAEKSAK
jgi:hypothetical protein